jgi:hypothetical protein
MKLGGRLMLEMTEVTNTHRVGDRTFRAARRHHIGPNRWAVHVRCWAVGRRQEFAAPLAGRAGQAGGAGYENG